MKNAKEAFLKQRQGRLRTATQTKQYPRKEQGNKKPPISMHSRRKNRPIPFTPRHDNTPIPRKMANPKASDKKKIAPVAKHGAEGGDRGHVATSVSSAVVSTTLPRERNSDPRGSINKKKSKCLYTKKCTDKLGGCEKSRQLVTPSLVNSKTTDNVNALSVAKSSAPNEGKGDEKGSHLNQSRQNSPDGSCPSNISRGKPLSSRNGLDTSRHPQCAGVKKEPGCGSTKVPCGDVSLEYQDSNVLTKDKHIGRKDVASSDPKACMTSVGGCSWQVSPPTATVSSIKLGESANASSERKRSACSGIEEGDMKSSYLKKARNDSSDVPCADGREKSPTTATGLCNGKSPQPTIIGLETRPKAPESDVDRKNNAHFDQKTSTSRVGGSNPQQNSIQASSAVSSTKRDCVTSTKKRSDVKEESEKSTHLKKARRDSSGVPSLDKQARSHTAGNGLNCTDKSPQHTVVVPMKDEKHVTQHIAPLGMKSEVKDSVNLPAVKDEKCFFDASAKAMRHIRDFRNRICGTFIAEIRVPAIHCLVLSEAARKAKNVEDQIYFSMVWDDDKIVSCPEENLPAFSPSMRVAFKSKSIPIRLNHYCPFTYEKRKIMLDVFKGNHKGQHVQLFTCSLSGESIVKRAIEQLNGKELPSVFVPCATTEYIHNAQVEFEVATSPFDAKYAEKKLMNTCSELLTFFLNDDISTVLGCLNLANELSERDALASYMGSKSYNALLSELLDVAIFVRNKEYVSHLLGLGAAPSNEGVDISQRLSRKCGGGNQSHTKSAEINYLISKQSVQ